MALKTLWAKSLRMLGKHEGHHALSHAEKHEKRPEYIEKDKNVFFFSGHSTALDRVHGWLVTKYGDCVGKHLDFMIND